MLTRGLKSPGARGESHKGAWGRAQGSWHLTAGLPARRVPSHRAGGSEVGWLLWEHHPGAERAQGMLGGEVQAGFGESWGGAQQEEKRP